MKLLSRDVFRSLTLAQASGFCCVPDCTLTAVDAHHILNRNLFTEPDEFGGYFLENGAQLCSKHHYDAELTRISVEELRLWCGVTEPAIPVSMDATLNYDCWGNEIIENGFRKAGSLFNDSGCQKALKTAGILWKFSTY